MITPGSAPEGAYIPGASFGPDNRGVNVNVAVDAAKAQMSAPYMNSFGDIGQILTNTLNGILQAVVGGIVAGAQAVGMVVTGVINTVTSAIQWVTNSIAAVFGGGSSTPNFTVGSTLADAYDKQQELIGKVDDLMVDNAGFINLSMSKNVYVDWTPNNWVFMPFDTHVTEHKNADMVEMRMNWYNATEYVPNIRRGTAGVSLSVSGGNGILFHAPGVWVIDGYVTTRPTNTSFRYFEVDVTVYEVTLSNSPTGPYYRMDEEYTKSRFTYGTDDAYIAAGSVHKPVIIPDDGKTYAAILAVRYQTEKKWEAWGGARWTSLSAVRQSIDTTDYNAQDAATGSVSITE